jgi:hypothetical protein
MPHCDTISDGNGGKFSGRAAGGINTNLGGSSLTLQSYVTRGSFIPATDYADQWSIYLFFR